MLSASTHYYSVTGKKRSQNDPLGYKAAKYPHKQELNTEKLMQKQENKMIYIHVH